LEHTRNCDALAELTLEGIPGGPGVITSPQIIVVPATATDCLNAKQVAAVKRLMTPVTNSKGEALF
jgi:hypothetical protein